MNEDLLLIKQLESLRMQHRDLDEKVQQDSLDEFSRKRFQKMKLAVRDEMAKLEKVLYPDIIA